MEDSLIKTNPEQLVPVEVEQEIPEASATYVPGPARNERKPLIPEDQKKLIQFTARATKAEAERINELIDVRDTATGRKHDIVRVVLALTDHIEADIIQTFKTKKKR